MPLRVRLLLTTIILSAVAATVLASGQPNHSWPQFGLLMMAILLAVLLDQKLRGIAVFRTLFFSPVVVSLVACTTGIWMVWPATVAATVGIGVGCCGLLCCVGVFGEAVCGFVLAR